MASVCKTVAAMGHHVVLALMWSAGESLCNVTVLVPCTSKSSQPNPQILSTIYHPYSLINTFVTHPSCCSISSNGTQYLLFSPSFLFSTPFYLLHSSSPSPYSPGQGVCCDSFTCMFVRNGSMNCSEENECAFAQTCKYPLF